jgi:PhnB protein
VKITPSITISFSGTCDEAMSFYEKCLGGKRGITMKWGDSPMATEAPPNWGNKILYANINIGGVELAGGDMTPDGYKAPIGMGIMLNVTDAGDAERIFNELLDGGKVNMPLSETFWAFRYGGLTDKFGVPWQINCAKPQYAG